MADQEQRRSSGGSTVPGDPWEVLAVRFGTELGRRAHYFYRYATYGEPDADERLDFFFWVVRSRSRVVLVDCGFSAESATRRPGRVLLTPVVDALAALGVRPEDVDDVIVTHLHWDHVGNLAAFPRARLHVQRAELDFWSSSCAAHPPQAAVVEDHEIAVVGAALAQGRVSLLDGDTEVAPGIVARLVGGHTPGQQVVVVDGPRPVLLASDAVHFFEEAEQDKPFGIFTDLCRVYDTFAWLRQQVAEGSVLVPGHDPRVLEQHPVLVSGDHGPVVVRVGPTTRQQPTVVGAGQEQ